MQYAVIASTCTRSIMNTTAGNHQWRIVVRHTGIIPVTQCCPSVMGLLSLTSQSHAQVEYVMRHIAIKTVPGRSWGRVAYLDILSSHSIIAKAWVDYSYAMHYTHKTCTKHSEISNVQGCW